MQAFVTLVTNDSYAKGASVLASSLKRVGTSRKVVCMIIEGFGLSQHSILLLRRIFDQVVPISPIDSGDSAGLALLGRPELGITFSKISAWSLVEYKKAVFLDADMLVLRNIDDLFERPELSAAPDSGWPDCFNSGLLVLEPDLDTYAKLVQFARERGSFDGGDQGLLNAFFADWSTSAESARRVPFTYNVTINTHYSYAPAFTHHQDQIRCIHFIGSTKPWSLDGNPAIREQTLQHATFAHPHFLRSWWLIYDQDVLPIVSACGNSSGAQASTQLAESAECHSSYGGCQHSYQQHCAYPMTNDTRNEFISYKIKWKKHVDLLVDPQFLMPKHGSSSLVRAMTTSADSSALPEDEPDEDLDSPRTL